MIDQLKFSTKLLLIVTFGAVLAPSLGFAQTIDLNVSEDSQLSLRAIQFFILISILSIVPGIVIMLTCFPFIVIVFSILRQAIGLQQSPPNMLLVSLALFLTWYVMEPVLMDAWRLGITPYIEGQTDLETSFALTMEPFRSFMANRVDVETIGALTELRTPGAQPPPDLRQTNLSVLVPSFLLSEVERAFQVGFLIFLPFLIIDLVVAAVLMSMGMMMVPPALVSLPFKLAFFVVADGWTLISETLVRSYL